MAYIPPRIAIYSLMIGCVIVKQEKKINNMKISQVIEKLQDIQDSFGDLDAYYYDTELGVEEIVTSININSNYNAIIFS